MLDGSGNEWRREAASRHDLDLPAIGRAVRRRKLWVAGPVLLCFAASAVAVNLVKPRYTAEAKILIENGDNFFTRPERTERNPDQAPDEEAVDSQVQLVSSRDIARDAIRALGLKGNPEFDPLAGGLGPLSRLLVLTGLERDPLRVPAEDRILSSYFDKLSVYPVAKSRVLTVQFTAEDPDLAARAVNTVSDLYIGVQSNAKRDSARTAAASLASLIADLKTRASEAEAKVQQYRAQTGLLVGTNNTTITAQQLADVNTQLAQARTAQADAEAKAKILRDMIRANRIAEVPDVANNDLIRRMADQRLMVKTQIAQLGETLLPGHPRMRELNAQLADIDAETRVAAEKVVRTLENDARIAAGRVDNLDLALDAQKKSASAAGADEVTLNNLDLQARLLKDQLEFNTQKYQEALARETSQANPADARIISRAVAPALPSFPKKGPMIAIFTLAGLVLSLGVVIGRELLSGRAFLRDATGPGTMPVQLGGEPAGWEEEAGDAPLRPTLPAGAPMVAGAGHADPDPDLALAVAAAEGRRRAEGGVRTLVTAPDGFAADVVPTALRVARDLARGGRVILVDCGAGGLEEVLRAGDAEPGPGLRDLLAGTASFAEAIHRDPHSRLHLVPFGATDAEAAVAGFGLMAEALAETYDHVVFAAPAPTAAGLPAAERADLAVLVDAGDASLEAVDACRAALYAAGVPEVTSVNARPPARGEERTAA